MNDNEQQQNEETSAKAEEFQQDKITAGDAATDLSTRLTPYEQWQHDYAHLLFDGTQSLASYIRLASDGEVECGLQVRVGWSYGGELALVYRMRVSHVVKPLERATDKPEGEPDSMEAADAKVAKLYAFMQQPENGNPWENESPYRLSLNSHIMIPLVRHSADLLPKFLALVENGLLDKLIERLPVPAAGWDTGDLRAFKQCLLDYLRLSVNQFKLFDEVKVTSHVWELDSTAGELDEALVQFLSGNGSEQGGSSNADPDSEG